MSRAKTLATRFIVEERGLETVEWAIITSLIVAGTIAILAAIGLWVAEQYETVQDELGA